MKRENHAFPVYSKNILLFSLLNLRLLLKIYHDCFLINLEFKSNDMAQFTPVVTDLIIIWIYTWSLTIEKPYWRQKLKSDDIGKTFSINKCNWNWEYKNNNFYVINFILPTHYSDEKSIEDVLWYIAAFHKSSKLLLLKKFI